MCMWFMSSSYIGELFRFTFGFCVFVIFSRVGLFVLGLGLVFSVHVLLFGCHTSESTV